MQPVSILFLFAIFMDTIQALGSILDARWAFRGEVVEGTYCTAQGKSQTCHSDGISKRRPNSERTYLVAVLQLC